MRIANNSLTVDDISVETTNPSLDDNINFDGIYLGHISNFCIQIRVTGTPNGSIKLQFSNDLGHSDQTLGGWSDEGVTTWTDVSNSSQTVNTAGDFYWEIKDAGYRWVRVVFTDSGGTGNITYARANLKGI